MNFRSMFVQSATMKRVSGNRKFVNNIYSTTNPLLLLNGRMHDGHSRVGSSSCTGTTMGSISACMVSTCSTNACGVLYVLPHSVTTVYIDKS